MSAVLTVVPEARTFRRSAASRRSALREAFDAELLDLGRQLRAHGAIGGAIRLRALAEIETATTTHDLCRMAAEAE